MHWHRLLPGIVALSVAAPAVAEPGAVTALAFSPDGKHLAVGLYGQVVVYDTAAWQPSVTLRQVEDTARALAFSPDGRLLAVGSGLPARSGRVSLWDPAAGTPPRTLAAQQDTVEALCFRPDGKGLLVGANDNKARLYTSLPSAASTTLDEHNGRVLAVAFPPKDGRVFITGAMDHVVKVWDASKAHTVANLDQATDGITGLAFLPNGTQFVGSSLDGKLRWWGVGYDTRHSTWSGYQYRTVDGNAGGIWCMAESADGRRLATGGADHQVFVWDAASGGKQRAFTDPKQPVYAVALSPDGKLAAAGGQEGVVWVWDVEGNKLVTALTPPALPEPPAPSRAPAKAHPAHRDQARPLHHRGRR